MGLKDDPNREGDLTGSGCVGLGSLGEGGRLWARYLSAGVWAKSEYRRLRNNLPVCGVDVCGDSGPDNWLSGVPSIAPGCYSCDKSEDWEK